MLEYLFHCFAKLLRLVGSGARGEILTDSRGQARATSHAIEYALIKLMEKERKEYPFYLT
ncbi:MAG: hypothetical protein OEY40_04495 [Candidatus Bathyarchaeota archaeon]|nr:hypothetical protein [Candidatus Bathyarchaeota archaeon]